MQTINSTMREAFAAQQSQLVMNVEYTANIAEFINSLCRLTHACASNAGWWNNPRNFGECIALIHSEISEALEGGRKDLMDDHLPHYTSVAVELADAVIRIADLAGGLSIPLGNIIIAKMRYNAQREDHKVATRAKEGGKQF